ncbi:MAG TPA: hypothetical protein DHU96_03805 [Actinobacteria bacterium]|nr:hypothetical protein [Actinomycetota bacterium]
MELKLTKEQAGHLESLLDSYLRDLSHEITATDNPEFRAGLRARRARLAEVAETLGLLLRGGPAEPENESLAAGKPQATSI